MHGEVFKDRSRNSAIFKMELFATIGNFGKLLSASSDMQEDSWICPWYLLFLVFNAINFNTQYKYYEQTNH